MLVPATVVCHDDPVKLFVSSVTLTHGEDGPDTVGGPDAVNSTATPTAISFACAVVPVAPELKEVPDVHAAPADWSNGVEVATPDSSNTCALVITPVDVDRVICTAVCPPAQFGSAQNSTRPDADDPEANTGLEPKLPAAPPRVTPVMVWLVAPVLPMPTATTRQFPAVVFDVRVTVRVVSPELCPDFCCTTAGVENAPPAGADAYETWSPSRRRYAAPSGTDTRHGVLRRRFG